MRAACDVIPKVYPERLRKVIVYNLPTIVTWILHLVLRLVDKVTRDKIVLFNGSDGKTAPCPEDLKKHVQHLGVVPDHARFRHTSLPPPPKDYQTAKEHALLLSTTTSGVLLGATISPAPIMNSGSSFFEQAGP
jgi:hypothetical protein